MTIKDKYEVVIIGAGPAGSAMASYLALEGVSCLIVERTQFPRPHVGESLVPSSMRIFEDIGFLDKLHTGGFSEKNGVGWTSTTTGADQRLHEFDFKNFGDDMGVNVDFAERQQQGLQSPYTYHVDRGKFDKMLADHAEELGAEILYETKISNVEFLDGAKGARVNANGQTISCDLVVDASGRNTVLGRQLGYLVKDPVFNQYAIHNWFECFEYGADEHKEFTYVHFIPESDTWIWQIPIAEDIMSVGVVSQMADFRRLDITNEEFFWQTVDKREDFSRRLRAARAMRKFKVEADYSYAMSQVCGDNYVMIGDAARFVDPIFSNGVSIALNSAKMAAEDTIKAIRAKRAFTKSVFDRYESLLKTGTGNWYRFISLYYRLNIIYMHFLSDKRYRQDTIKILQGDVYDDPNPWVLDEMEKLVQAVEQNSGHIFHRFMGNLSAHIQSNHMAAE